MGFDWAGFQRREKPFTHWVNPAFLSPEQVIDLNATWPPKEDERWRHEVRDYTTKSAIVFPRRLHEPAQALATALYAEDSVAALRKLTGLPLLVDPWFCEGPLTPMVGGGLHEIHPGGLLKMHVDFSAHPTGLTRALNFLIYLNQEWNEDWLGALELGTGEVKIYPRGGTAVIFETTGTSWHGHPAPLKCPEGKTRRSLALYYYREATAPPERFSTVYRRED